jgi:class 3 adenylate cyclase
VTHPAADALTGARELAETTEDSEASTSPAINRPPAERRPVTVLSASIVSFPLSASELDPEELLDTIAALYGDCAEAINRYDGFVANLAGNGLLAYFGYPAAHEDDAERAARAGLTLVDLVGRFEAPYRLRARLGIATGLVVIGGVMRLPRIGGHLC